MSQIIKREFRFTGKHMLITMISFFGVIIAVNLTMATLASKSWTGLIVKNTYVASQQFNEHLDQAKRQQETGIRSQLRYDNNGLIVIVEDSDGSRIRVDELTAHIGRPAYEQADQTLVLIPAPDDCYKLRINLEPGVWDVRITGTVDKVPYRRDARLLVAADGRGKFE